MTERGPHREWSESSGPKVHGGRSRSCRQSIRCSEHGARPCQGSVNICQVSDVNMLYVQQLLPLFPPEKQ